MLSWIRSAGVLFALIALGLILLLTSVVLVGKDVASARSQAESEVVGLAETAALAIEFAPTDKVESYLSGLLQHPAIAGATVYSSNGKRIVRRRTTGAESPFIQRITPSLGDPVVGCKAIGATSVCLTADMTYFHRRLAALIIPHAILLAAAALMLVVASILGRGSNRKQLGEVANVLKTATKDNNYALRAPESGELGQAVNSLLEQMQQRDVQLRRRTTEMESANRELEAFSYAVSHDLRTPLAAVDGFTQALDEGYRDKLDAEGQECLTWIQDGIQQMKNLVSGLLQMSRLARADLTRTRVNLSDVAKSIADLLKLRDPARSVEFRIAPDLFASGDERLLYAVLENLMSNAYKFTGKKEKAVITVGATTEGGKLTYFVKDNGAGFDSTAAAKMFTPFQRLHSSSEFEGTGIGLSTVKRIVERHGGTIWAEGQVGEGATFYFTLGDAPIPAMTIPELTSV